MFGAFAKYTIDNGGVVYGVAYNDKLDAVFVRAETMDEIEPIYSSKYVQADAGNIYKKALADAKSGRKVLFTGTPCQIAAFRSFVQNRYDNVLLVDIICHGTPSPKVFHDFVDYYGEKHNSKVVKYVHRSKVCGWQHIEEITLANGEKDHSSWLSGAWKNIFYNNCVVRPSCSSCEFVDHAKNRAADITVSDFWGIEENHPEFYSNNGVSYVGIYTQQGEKWFAEIEHNLTTIPVTVDDILVRQPQYEGKPIEPKNREFFWEMYRTKGISEIVKTYGKVNIKDITKTIIKRTQIYKKLRGVK